MFMRTIMHTPGHSHDSIMLLDQENRILLTGDTFCEYMIVFSIYHLEAIYGKDRRVYEFDGFSIWA